MLKRLFSAITHLRTNPYGTPTNGGAAIVDYSITTSDINNSGTRIASGAEISLFIKVHYKRRVSAPIVGFELKAVNGITVFGTNTNLAQTYVSQSLKGEMRLYRFDFRLPLNGGDYFVDLGVAENDGSRGGAIMEVRRSIIHFVIETPMSYEFMGIFDLDASFSEIPLGDGKSNTDSVTEVCQTPEESNESH